MPGTASDELVEPARGREQRLDEQQAPAVADAVERRGERAGEGLGRRSVIGAMVGEGLADPRWQVVDCKSQVTGADDGADTSEEPRPMSVLTELQEAVAAVATAAAPSVVGIGSRTRGSGVVIADGAVLTNAHNLRGGEVTVRFADGRATRGTVAGVDWDGDLAVVSVDTTGTTPIAWSTGGATIGSAVFAAAATPSGGARVSFGFVSSVERAFRGPGGRRISGSLEHTAPLAPGLVRVRAARRRWRARRPQHEPGRRGVLPRAAGRRVAEVTRRCARPRRVQGAPAAGDRRRAGARRAAAAPVGRAPGA